MVHCNRKITKERSRKKRNQASWALQDALSPRSSLSPHLPKATSSGPITAGLHFQHNTSISIPIPDIQHVSFLCSMSHISPPSSTFLLPWPKTCLFKTPISQTQIKEGYLQMQSKVLKLAGNTASTTPGNSGLFFLNMVPI